MAKCKHKYVLCDDRLPMPRYHSGQGDICILNWKYIVRKCVICGNKYDREKETDQKKGLSACPFWDICDNQPCLSCWDEKRKDFKFMLDKKRRK